MKQSNTVLLTLNVAGALLLFLTVKSVVNQAEMEERAMDGVDSISLLARMVPLLLAFALIDLAWAIKACADVLRRQGWEATRAIAWALAFWLAACAGLGFSPWSLIEFVRLLISFSVR